MPPGLRLLLMYLAFFLSGGATLGYQMVWTRQFSVGLGHEFASVIAVVAAFFGGMALGAWALDRRIAKATHPARWYTSLEVLVAVWGIITIALIPALGDRLAGWLGSSPSFTWQWLTAFVVPAVALGPATAAMGATLAAMDRLVSPLAREGRAIGALYAANTAGALVGVIAGAFFVLPALGLSASLAMFAIATAIAGGLVWVATRGQSTDAPSMTPSHEKHQPDVTHNERTIWLVVFGSGLLGIGYEVLGVRMLGRILENSIYSFAAILAVYLIGTAIGAAWYQRYGARFVRKRLLAWLLTLLAIACLCGGLTLPWVLPAYQAARETWGDSMGAVAAAEMSAAAMVFLWPTVLMGATFSHLVQRCKRPGGGVGRAVAVNTLGAALGPMVFGVALMPLVGARLSFIALAAGYIVMSAVIMPKGSRAIMFARCGALLLMCVSPSLRLVDLPPGQRLLSYEEGVMASVAVIQQADGERLLRVNNRFQMGGTSAAHTELRQGHLPLLLHANPKRALFLGLGTGITFRAAAAHRGLVADGVELVPEVVHALAYFEPDDPLVQWDDRKLNVFTADARRFIAATDESYDVIVADFFHPGRDGAGSLYTREHFMAVRDHLAVDGLFCQWLPLYQLDESTLRMIVRTFLSVFPDAQGFVLDMKVSLPGLALVGGRGPLSWRADWYEHRVDDAALRAHLRSLGLGDGLRLFGLRVASAAQLARFARFAASESEELDKPINTDDHPYVTFRAPQFTVRKDATPHGRLMDLLDHMNRSGNADESDYLVDGFISRGDASAESFRKTLGRYTNARDHYLRGLAADVEGRRDEAIAQYLKAMKISDDFTTAYAQGLLLATRLAIDDVSAARRLLEAMMEVQPGRPEAAALLGRLRDE